MSLYPLFQRLLLNMDPEKVHGLTIRLLKAGLGPRQSYDDPVLCTNVWGRDFRNPLGLAAGFDKDAEAIEGIFGLGFGFVEAGTVTPLAQPGNPRPRVFRDVANKSVINRMGFPGKGLEYFAENVAAWRRRRKAAQGILGLNIGINKDTASPADDYRQGIARLARYADYIAINVSSPNTAGLRGLQEESALDSLLAALMAARAGLDRHVPLALKIAPDLDAAQRQAVAQVALAQNVDGLIVSNTTVARPDALAKELKGEKGGLSGRLLRGLATERVADFYALTQGRIPIIGAGGISSAEDAYARIRAGASLVQLYTGLVFEGPQLVTGILKGLAALLKRDGFSHVAQAVGADAGAHEAARKAAG